MLRPPLGAQGTCRSHGIPAGRESHPITYADATPQYPGGDDTAPAGLVVKQSYWTWSGRNIAKGLFLKASYWRWPDRDLAGNSIDFYVKVVGTSFSDAMKELTGGCQ
jgi:hypothetical protein